MPFVNFKQGRHASHTSRLWLAIGLPVCALVSLPTTAHRPCNQLVHGCLLGEVLATVDFSVLCCPSPAFLSQALASGRKCAARMVRRSFHGPAGQTDSPWPCLPGRWIRARRLSSAAFTPFADHASLRGREPFSTPRPRVPQNSRCQGAGCRESQFLTKK